MPREDGLFIIAYQNAGGPIIFPKKSKYRTIVFKTHNFSSVYEMSYFIRQALPLKKFVSDSIIFEDPPVQTLKYPLIEGSQWTYRHDYDSWRIDKTVVGKREIHLELGLFHCYHIKWLYDMDNDALWDEDIWIDDFLSEEGLIKRKITILGVDIRIENGEYFGSCDFFDEFILTGIHL